MKACIYGAGAIGGWLGVALAQAGHTLSMVARGDTLRALQAEGLRLRRPDGTLAQVAVTAHNDPAGHLTVVDPADPSRATSRVHWGFLLQGLLDQK